MQGYPTLTEAEITTKYFKDGSFDVPTPPWPTCARACSRCRPASPTPASTCPPRSGPPTSRPSWVNRPATQHIAMFGRLADESAAPTGGAPAPGATRLPATGLTPPWATIALVLLAGALLAIVRRGTVVGRE